MRVLLVGSGGREHALAWKIRQSPLVDTLYIAPGNGGTAALGENVALRDDDIPGLVAFAKDKGVGLVIGGPELPLVLGLTDAMTEAGIPCFGPDAFAARLEGSKAFAKKMMADSGVPTASFAVFDDYAHARGYLETLELPVVVKADGLAAGKGVVVAKTLDEALEALDEMMVRKIFGKAGERVVIEEALSGEEVSLLAFCDGERVVPMSSAQDHKAVGDDDTGPNTGGMGAYSPAPILPDAAAPAMIDLTIRPVVRHLAELGHPFKGVIYAGLMMTSEGPMVLEYNVRFGDPECQPLLSRLDSDIVTIMLDCAAGKLDPASVKWNPKTAVCVVLAAKGYPGSYPKGMRLHGLAEAEKLAGVKVFQAGTKLEAGQPVSSGGRILGVTALADGLAAAQALAYEAVARIEYDNKYHRNDIAAKGLRRI